MNTLWWYICQIPGGIFTALVILSCFALFAMATIGLCLTYEFIGTRFDRWINSLHKPS